MMLKYISIFPLFGYISARDCKGTVWLGNGKYESVEVYENKLTKFLENEAKAPDFDNYDGKCGGEFEGMDEDHVIDALTDDNGSCIKKSTAFLATCSFGKAFSGNNQENAGKSVNEKFNFDKKFADFLRDNEIANEQFEDEISGERGYKPTYTGSGHRFSKSVWNVIVSGGPEFCTDFFPRFPKYNTKIGPNHVNYHAVRKVWQSCHFVMKMVKQMRSLCKYVMWGDRTTFPKPSSKQWRASFKAEDAKICWYFSILKRTGVVRPKTLAKPPNFKQNSGLSKGKGKGKGRGNGKKKRN